MVSAVVIGLIRIKYEMEKAVPDMKSLLAEVPDYWKETFKSLDAEGQSYFVQSLSRIDKEIAAFDKRTKELRLDEDQLAAARTAIRLKGMREFVENNYEEIKSARERRILLERMEESFRAHKKELYEKGLADIRIFTDEDIRQAQRSAANKEEYEQKLAKITKDRAEQKLALDKKYAGEMAAIDNVQLRRRIADEREYQEEVVKIRQRYARLMATLETDPAKKLKAEYEARIGVIRSNLARELSAALDNKDKIVEAEVKAHNAMMKAWRTYIFDKGKLEQEKTEETLKLEASQLELRLESMRSAAAEQYETSETFRMKELELEEQLLLKYNALAAKRYELNKSLLGEEHKETIKSKRELQDTLIDLERNYGDQRRLQEKTRLKGLEKDTQEYLENRILQMKRQGATEEEIERTRWEHMAEYSDSWLKRIRAGLGLATLDFREASRDWAGLVQDMADQASASLGEFFYGVMKDSKDLSDVWKNMLDAMLRYLADFMAKKAVYDFLAMIGQIASGYAGGGAGTGAKPESGAYHSGPLYQAHRGGEVGVDIMPRRFAPDWLFNLAPRLHTGLRPDEFPAILQRGEEVVPRGERDGGVRTVNIFTPDTRTMAEWVRRNRGVFASATIDTIKDGDRGLIGAIRSVSRG
jgi:lambda family phage tail tape measure protein